MNAYHCLELEQMYQEEQLASVDPLEEEHQLTSCGAKDKGKLYEDTLAPVW